MKPSATVVELRHKTCLLQASDTATTPYVIPAYYDCLELSRDELNLSEQGGNNSILADKSLIRV